MSIKSAVRRHAPWLIPIYSYVCWNFLIRPKWRRIGISGVFAEHYRANGWQSRESRSGTGSTLQQTAAIRDALPRLVQAFGVKTILDIPCGDFNWMKHLDLPVRYTGADIVEEIVSINRENFTNDGKTFIQCDLTRDTLPTVDLIVCRDCFVHLSFQHIWDALTNIRESGSEMLLTTTHVSQERNSDIVTGEWRPLNLEKAPFLFPRPIMSIDEQNPDSATDKHLALWRVCDLPWNAPPRP
jgi:SAM-dependent methyltransferase